MVIAWPGHEIFISLSHFHREGEVLLISTI